MLLNAIMPDCEASKPEQAASSSHPQLTNFRPQLTSTFSATLKSAEG